MTKINHSDWQKRKESAEGITAILEKYKDKKIHLNCATELLTMLKSRIADPNKHIIKTFVHLTTVVF